MCVSLATALISSSREEFSLAEGLSADIIPQKLTASVSRVMDRVGLIQRATQARTAFAAICTEEVGSPGLKLFLYWTG